MGSTPHRAQSAGPVIGPCPHVRLRLCLQAGAGVPLGDSEAIDRDALTRAVGKEGLLLRVGVVDNKYVVATFGGGRARVDAVLGSVRADRAPLAADPGIRKSAGNVAARRSVEGHFAVDRLVGLIHAVRRAMDLPVVFPAMPELSAPISWAVHSVGPSAVQVDVYIPMELVVAVKDAAMQQAVRGMRIGSFPGS